ncbi:MAG TPA: helix-turn-helix transcriptional regulator, partial [Acidimicrobiales bacterium]|nr:helix-turn-helix transcriptional regulator [Acidimicrobiales bacterium]
MGRMEGIRSFSGTALRRARVERGLSHDALARLTGRTRGHLIHWEQGRYRPSPALLVILAQALDLDPLELLDVTEDTATLPDLRGRVGLATVDVADHLG